MAAGKKGAIFWHWLFGQTIDLVLIDQQSVGKGSLHLINTINAKKRWKTICWRVNKYLK
jgi:hypothetical protein